MDINNIPMTPDEIIVRLSHLARTAPSASLQLRALTLLMRCYGMLQPAKTPRTRPASPAPDRTVPGAGRMNPATPATRSAHAPPPGRPASPATETPAPAPAPHRPDPSTPSPPPDPGVVDRDVFANAFYGFEIPREEYGCA